MSDIKNDTIKRSNAVEVVYKALKTPPLKGVLTDIMSLAIALVQDIPSADRPTVIRVKSILKKEDYESLAESIRQQDQNVIVIPHNAELVTTADRPQGEWIPCSKRLPEYRDLVNVTTRDLRVKLAYLDSIQEDGTDDFWTMPLDDANCALWNIVAWMPLPEPWKGADDEVR